MDIKTKFEVYDEIYFLSNNKACKSKIRGIKIEVISCPQDISAIITYLCNTDEESSVNIKVDEQTAFKTKEELLKSL